MQYFIILLDRNDTYDIHVRAEDGGSINIRTAPNMPCVTEHVNLTFSSSDMVDEVVDIDKAASEKNKAEIDDIE